MSAPRHLRVLTAASWGRADAVGSEFDLLPDDLASPLWRRTAEFTARPDRLTPRERGAAGTLMLRLGYPASAVSIMNPGAGPGSAALPADLPPEALPALVRALMEAHPRPAEVEAEVLRIVTDPRTPPAVRLILWVPALAAAVRPSSRIGPRALPHLVAEAERTLREAGDGAQDRLGPSGVWRVRLSRALCEAALACGRRAAALDHADGAALPLLRARPASDAAAPDRLAWELESMSLLRTQARLARRSERFEEALKAASAMARLDPFDPGAHTAHAEALLRAGRHDDALRAYERVFALGGVTVAAAAFGTGWIHEQRGDLGRAREAYELSHRIDPTVPVAAARLTRATPPAGPSPVS
ncbi:tetratricopeptide repeat protein [Streptomyces sp. NPDC059708]|uniref:tetratricopeptide repeat protein n=1 Tax=Streptomyces sp. NPDC059708 TaxID=3346916 RepID=UPI0036AEFDFF